MKKFRSLKIRVAFCDRDTSQLLTLLRDRWSIIESFEAPDGRTLILSRREYFWTQLLVGLGAAKPLTSYAVRKS